jgi:D-amino peptidase
MKIFIMTDMECVSGITMEDNLNASSPHYQDTRAGLTGDVNAAVEGCFRGGATAVVVKDAHGLPGNLILDDLDPRVQLVPADPANWSGLDASVDATLMLGQHAKAGTMNAFLDHTQSSASIFDFTANGTSLGEMGQWALMAGHFNVPVIMLAGDDAACREAAALLPRIRTVSVGTAGGRLHMAARPRSAVRPEITAAVAAALADRAGWPAPYKLKTPLTVRVTFHRTDMADRACRLRFDRTRIDGRTVEMKVNSAMEILGIFV